MTINLLDSHWFTLPAVDNWNYQESKNFTLFKDTPFFAQSKSTNNLLISLSNQDIWSMLLLLDTKNKLIVIPPWSITIKEYWKWNTVVLDNILKDVSTKLWYTLLVIIKELWETVQEKESHIQKVSGVLENLWYTSLYEKRPFVFWYYLNPNEREEDASSRIFKIVQWQEKEVEALTEKVRKRVKSIK